MKPVIGLMSGTSMDGIDCALVDVETHRLLDGFIHPYPVHIQLILETILQNQHVDLIEFFTLHRLIGEAFADAVLALMKKNRLSADDIVAIGSHGQTVFHAPRRALPLTCQLGCAHTIAQKTGILTVADFRTRDLIVGGEGAPFAPVYHDVIFSHLEQPLAVVNIGGIANISVLQKNKPVYGFDVGSGNCLMDAWCMRHQEQPFDADGIFASQGAVIERLLSDLLSDPFMMRDAPKSICKSYFSLQWLLAFLKPDDKAADVQATLLELTAQGIVRSIKALDTVPHRVLICGGGVHNPRLMARLCALLPDMTVQSTASVGVNPDFLEAQIFAWLAVKALHHEVVDLRHITGARQSVVLGAIYPA